MDMTQKIRVALEPVDDTHIRLISFEPDFDTGHFQVKDIAEFTPTSTKARALIDKAISTGALDRVLIGLSARWSADVSRCRSDAGRILKLARAYPGSAACGDEMIDIVA